MIHFIEYPYSMIKDDQISNHNRLYMLIRASNFQHDQYIQRVIFAMYQVTNIRSILLCKRV